MTRTGSDVRVNLYRDDLWPYYDARRIPLRGKGGRVSILISSRTYRRWQKVMEEFSEVQREMREYYDRLG